VIGVKNKVTIFKEFFANSYLCFNRVFIIDFYLRSLIKYFIFSFIINSLELINFLENIFFYFFTHSTQLFYLRRCNIYVYRCSFEGFKGSYHLNSLFEKICIFFKFMNIFLFFFHFSYSYYFALRRT
jgi:hypothetical protein